MTREEFKHLQYQNPDRNWCEVELFRWQYGGLPQPNDFRKIDLKEASRKMALAIDEGKVAPFNAAVVIAYLGKLASEKEIGNGEF